ncbi:hypothetical protein Chor_003121, partial [Crotalus horridus]
TISTMDSLAEANTRFVVDLFKRTEEEQSNRTIFFSPFSIIEALAMVLFGARGNTALEMEKEQSKKVQMMAQTGRFNYAKITNPPMEVLELPYDKGILSMYIFLPDKNGTTQEIVKQLSYKKCQEWTSSTSMQVTMIMILLPKFKVEEEYALIPTLKKMGMKDVFIAHKADLSGISESPDLVVSEFRHKACIEVNEEGTEAAAATDVVTVPTSAQTIPKFNVNRPIFFIIKHNSTKSILFAGKIFSP